MENRKRDLAYGCRLLAVLVGNLPRDFPAPES